MSIFNLYLITILPNIRDFFTFLSIGILIIFLIIMLVTSLTVDFSLEKATEEAAKKVRRDTLSNYKLFISLFLIFSIFSVLIPTERQIYQIVGGYSVTNIEGISKLPANLVGVANKYLEELQKSK